MLKPKLYFFGEPRLLYQDQPLKIERRKALGLLAYLGLSEQLQGRDTLCSLFWPELDQSHAHAALRSTLSALTTVIPGDWLHKTRDALAINPEHLWIDVRAFLGLIARSRMHDHVPTGVCADCEPLLVEAVDLCSADFMASFAIAECAEFDQWQMLQREWLRHELSVALGRLAAFYRESENFDAGLLRARQWLTLDRLHEPAYRELMRLYIASDQRVEALRTYQQCVEVLDAELATIPGDETTLLYQSIKANRVSRSQLASWMDTTFRGILPPLPPLLVGRDQALNELITRLGIQSEQEWCPVTVIQGWPGVGKSTLVAALAHTEEVAKLFPDGVLWTSLCEMPNVLAQLTGWLNALRLNVSDQAHQVEDVALQLTTVLRDRRMLLIVDDVWKTEHAIPFRVGGKGCAILYTTRLNGVAQELAPAARNVYRLSVLEDQAALDLLTLLTPETVSRHPVESRRLVRDLEGLPLAIQVAGRLLHNETHLGWGVDNLLAELQTGASLLLAQPPSDIIGSGRDASPTVAALLRRSTDALDPQTRQHFAFLGLFAHKPATFGLEAMAVAWDVPDAKPTTRILVSRGLLEPISGGRFQMHALLVAHARSLLDEQYQ